MNAHEASPVDTLDAVRSLDRNARAFAAQAAVELDTGALQ
jgi:hypothetical protein